MALTMHTVSIAMKVAVPLIQSTTEHGDEIAPRFCSADRFQITWVIDGKISRQETVPIPREAGMVERIQALARDQVDHLLCGGFNRRFLEMAEHLGIEVYWGLWGSAQSAVQALIEGKPLPFLPRGRRRRRWRRKFRS